MVEEMMSPNDFLFMDAICFTVSMTSSAMFKVVLMAQNITHQV